MSCEQETGEVLRAGGRRLTAQRSAIATALRHAGDHRSAGEIHGALTSAAATAAAGTAAAAEVSLATVYRTLETLRDSQLATAIEGPDGKTRYAWVDQQRLHLHLVCSECGAAREVAGEPLAGVAAAIRERTGFEPFLAHLSVRGRCERCRSRMQQPAAAQ